MALDVAERALTIRVLPPEEWTRIQGIEPFLSKGLPTPTDSWMILVVERGERIVGTCSLFIAAHWDCWWIDPREPGSARGVILRQLLRAALDSFNEAGVLKVYTGAEHDAPDVVDFLTRFGFHMAPGRLFVLQVAELAGTVRT